MRRRKINKFTILLILLLGITLGYALISTTLKMTGTTGIAKHSWNVYWDNAVVNPNCSTPTVNPTIGQNSGEPTNTKVTWTATLTFPGDYYEFTVDAVNNGDIDAMVSSVDPVIIPALPDYIKYEITYDDGSTPAQYDKLAKKQDDEPTIQTYNIKVWYDKAETTASTVNDMYDDETYTFSLGITYEMATEEAMTALERRMAAILADPDSYRNSNQPVSNKDIGIDEAGNVINLDDWVSYSWSPDEPDKFYYRAYSEDKNNVKTYYDRISIGDCSGNTTIATASERIVNGKMTTPIPSYVLLDGQSEFFPVTELFCIWGDTSNHGRTHITEFPDMPKTVVELGAGLFWDLGEFENIEIPKRIKYIDYLAFSGAFKQNGTNNTVTFENGSKLTRIGWDAFEGNKLKGDLVLPQKVNLIEKNAFTGNNLTSVTFSSTAEYSTNCVDYGSCDSFDAGVTINHNY